MTVSSYCGLSRRADHILDPTLRIYAMYFVISSGVRFLTRMYPLVQGVVAESNRLAGQDTKERRQQ